MRTNNDRHIRRLIWGVFSLALGAACLLGATSVDSGAGPRASSFDAQVHGGAVQPVAEALSLLELVGLRTQAQPSAATSDSLLMSCADDDPQQRSGAEPMWCASPDSPHCLPALPKPPAPDATNGPVATLLSVLVPPPAVALVLHAAWPAPAAEHTRSLQLSQRLERPPRSV